MCFFNTFSPIFLQFFTLTTASQNPVTLSHLSNKPFTRASFFFLGLCCYCNYAYELFCPCIKNIKKPLSNSFAFLHFFSAWHWLASRRGGLRWLACSLTIPICFSLIKFWMTVTDVKILRWRNKCKEMAWNRGIWGIVNHLPSWVFWWEIICWWIANIMVMAFIVFSVLPLELMAVWRSWEIWIVKSSGTALRMNHCTKVHFPIVLSSCTKSINIIYMKTITH